MLTSIGNGFGRYLKRDNATACVTHLEAARICLEIDVSKPLRKSFWLGPPGLASSHYQETPSKLVANYTHTKRQVMCGRGYNYRTVCQLHWSYCPCSAHPSKHRCEAFLGALSSEVLYSPSTTKDPGSMVATDPKWA
ncbi:uncharacterized protein LOC118347890 [Juglans regia]|uniref:Uncharacterized protein LOC118347890 n=1 Tax=Juglans regia TaxID=51240 RepID=A0A6P9E971_JUGRE|nr:uncharacterized protein LOC118347890 [Juglans regia]